MPVEIICSLIAVIGVIVSAVISLFVARSASRKEIEKLRLTWQREDSLSSDKEFSEMVSAVSYYVNSQGERSRLDAMNLVAPLRCKETGPLANALDELYDLLQKGDRSGSKQSLESVINQKRSRSA